MARFVRTDTVEAVQLTWDNWQQVANVTGGKFVQGMSIQKSSGAISDGRAYLMIPRGGDEPGERRAEMYWWIVQEGDEWIGMPDDLFRRLYRPALELGL